MAPDHQWWRSRCHVPLRRRAVQGSVHRSPRATSEGEGLADGHVAAGQARPRRIPGAHGRPGRVSTPRRRLVTSACSRSRRTPPHGRTPTSPRRTGDRALTAYRRRRPGPRRRRVPLRSCGPPWRHRPARPWSSGRAPSRAREIRLQRHSTPPRHPLASRGDRGAHRAATNPGGPTRSAACRPEPNAAGPPIRQDLLRRPTPHPR